MTGKDRKAKEHDSHYGVKSYVLDRDPQIGDHAWLQQGKELVHVIIQSELAKDLFYVIDAATGQFALAAGSDLQIVELVDGAAG